MTASGSSPLTWKMGALTTRATSVQYGEDREKRGSVVNLNKGEGEKETWGEGQNKINALPKIKKREEEETEEEEIAEEEEDEQKKKKIKRRRRRRRR